MPTKVVLIVEQLVRLANRHPSVFGYIKEESGGTNANERILHLNAVKLAIKNVFAARGVVGHGFPRHDNSGRKGSSASAARLRRF